MDQETISAYNKNAAEYCSRWEQADPALYSLLPHIFSQCRTVLEIGFGSGRDMSFLLNELQLDVYGIEVSDALMQKACELHPELHGRLYQGSLPDSIPQTEMPVRQFDGLLLSAVITHIPDEELFQSAFQIRELLKVNGTLAVSFPVERGDINPESNRDSSGRLMLIRPESRIRLLFERLGFELSGSWQSDDSLGREDIHWTTLVLTYRGSTVSESVDKIESIINRDRKTATYKLALLKALCDIALIETNTVSWDNHGNVHIPVSAVVRKWMEYYWPIVSAERFIPQIRGEHNDYEKPIAFRSALQELAEHYKDMGGLPQFIFDRDNNKLEKRPRQLLKTAGSKIRTAVISGPVYYSGGGGNADKPFSYEKETKTIVFHSDIWRELVLLGHWIGDSISMRWAQLTRELSRDSLELQDIIHLFLNPVFPERNVSAARTVYAGAHNLECVWSGKVLTRSFDVDHAIPYSLRHDNSLWNLLPAHPDINNHKRDKLPTQNVIRENRDKLVYYWELLNNELTDVFRSDFTRFTGRPKLPKSSWQQVLYLSFSEAVETTASRRGIERWEP
jgi:hypothetical protein